MSSSQTPGVAGRTNYGEWSQKVSDLIEEVEKEEEQEKENAKKQLGLDGKYAFSKDEQEEKEKSKKLENSKRVLETYRQREANVMQTFSGLLTTQEETKSDTAQIVRITRDRMEAGKRVVTLCDITGSSQRDQVILTQDLSHLESKMNAPLVRPKSYREDGENGVQTNPQQPRTIFGLIKLFISNVHNCTISVKCKLITGTIELSHCSNVTLKIEKDATVATCQVDLCQSVSVEFHDAPSGKSMPGRHPKMYWGEDADDRVFSAGVKDMKVAVYRDGFQETSLQHDYLKDGAVAVGNASPEECQFVISCVDGELIAEKVVRHGSTTGKNARAMTQRELNAEKEKREKAAAMALDMAESMVKIKDKDGNEVKKVEKKAVGSVDEAEVEEVFTSMDKSEIDAIVAECEQNKMRGNEAFSAGEYAQAVLLYSLALDKASELPDTDAKGDKQVFPRHVVYSNRSAAFLKLGDHEKAFQDGTRAQELDPTYIKGIFRRGLALHALGRYQEAIEALAKAHKIEPQNKQIKQALQFAEVRMTQEMRKRME